MKVYFETSAVIDFILATGYEYSATPFDKPNDENLQYLQTLLNEEKRFHLVANVRKILTNEFPDIECILSPLVLFEVYEWICEERFRTEASEIYFPRFVRQFSRKQIGSYLTKIKTESSINRAAKSLYQGILQSLNSEELLALTPQNILIELNNSNFAMFVEYAYCQIGLADVLHLFAAKNLNCAYFFTKDEDYKRVKDMIRTDFGLELVYRHEILELLKNNT